MARGQAAGLPCTAGRTASWPSSGMATASRSPSTDPRSATPTTAPCGTGCAKPCPWCAPIRPSSRCTCTERGPDFCSGGDLNEFGTLTDPATAHLVRTTRSAARLLGVVGDRVVAHLHGACVGAGIELPALAGRIVAAPDTRLQLPEVAMGLIPGAGGTATLPRRIGRHRTAWLALTGHFVERGHAHARGGWSMRSWRMSAGRSIGPLPPAAAPAWARRHDGPVVGGAAR